MTIVGSPVATAGYRRAKLRNTLLLGLFLLYTFFPLYYLVVASTKSNLDLFSTFGLWFASDFDLVANLKDLFSFSGGVFGRWLLNTFLYATISALGAALVSTAAGYAFAKFHFPGRNAIFAAILGAIMIPQTALVVPIYLLLARAGLIDNPLGVILPTMVSPVGVTSCAFTSNRPLTTRSSTRRGSTAPASSASSGASSFALSRRPS